MIRQLNVAPLKRGIPQIVEHGSRRKWGFTLLWLRALVSLGILRYLLPIIVSTIFADKLMVHLLIVAALCGAV